MRGPGPAAAPRRRPGPRRPSRAVSRTRSSAGRAAHSMPSSAAPAPVAGAQLLQHRRQEGLDRPDAGSTSPRRRRRCGRTSPRRAGRRRRGCAARQRLARAPRGRRPGRHSRCSSPAPPAAALRPADPAAQLGRLRAGQAAEKALSAASNRWWPSSKTMRLQGGGLAVGLRAARRAGAVEGGLGQHQGVVGDDEVGPARGADRLLDETGAVVRAGGVDALAAPVDQVGGAGLGRRRRPRTGSGSQAGEVAAGHVAVAGGRAAQRRSGPCRSGRRCPAGRPAPAPGSSAGRGSSRAPCGPRPSSRARPGRDRGRGSRARSGAAGRGCRSRPRPPARWPRPTARRGPDSPGSCRCRCRPRPASCAARPRARAAGRRRRSRRRSRPGSAGPRRGPSACQQLGQPLRRRPRRRPGCEPGSPGGASSSHSGSRDQTSRPEPR